MFEINVENVIQSIRQKIIKGKEEQENLIDFVARELAKKNTVGGNELEFLINHIHTKYYTKDELKSEIEKRISDFKDLKLQKQNFVTSNMSMSDQNGASKLDLSASGRILNGINNLTDKLERSRDLTCLEDTVLHFSKPHLGIVKRIFDLQIVQNYLAALKVVIVDDLVRQQSEFNVTTEESIKNILHLINALRREIEISITELKNYQNDSQNWIRNDELILHDMQEKIKNFETNLLPQVNAHSSFITENHKKIKSIDNLGKKLADYEPSIKSIDNLGKKLADYEPSIKSIDKQEVSINELKNYQHDSEKWIHDNEVKIKDLESNITNYQSSINKNQTLTNDGDRELEIKINENYNELKELIITRDLKTTEFLLRKINKIEQMIKGIDEETQKKREK